MGRFNMKTQSPTLSAVLRSFPEWKVKYHADFRALGDVQLPVDPDALADELERNEAVFLREQRDDVGVTNQRDQTITDVQGFAGAISARVRYLTQGDETAAVVRRNILNIAPSKLRTFPAALKALDYMASGVEKHRELFSGSDGADAQLAHIEGLRQRISQCQRDEGREAQETRLARQARDATKLRVLDTLERTELAAIALSYVNPEPLLSLRAIFDKFLPQSRNTTGPVDEELELGAAVDDPAEVDDALTTTSEDESVDS